MRHSKDTETAHDTQRAYQFWDSESGPPLLTTVTSPHRHTISSNTAPHPIPARRNNRSATP
ncbi:hypothetical protein GOAMR_24_00500 [Gordonia amarae NBRC 15530]|uniref:Uncharacterized protein n=1 Tax=Gordonia amarae NBRC 15530 TaxID=1075090 RepID=G7GMV1_9ACTN|nr:hypothetical protein GOAMR_24_00500 [Gordonia amarae NBRC 15530]